MNILIVRMSSLGDVIQAIPVVADLLAQYPKAQIDWVVEEAFAPLLTRVHGLRRVLPIAQRRWRKSRFSAAVRAEKQAFYAELHSTRYNAVLDLQGLVKSAWVARQARLAAGGFRATYGNASDLCSWEWPVRYLLDRPVPMERVIHAVQRPRTLAARALGYALAGAPRYGLQAQPLAGADALPVRTVVLVHGTTRADNEWPVAHWVALGVRLAAAGWQVALPQASDAECARAQAIAQAITQAVTQAIAQSSGLGSALGSGPSSEPGRTSACPAPASAVQVWPRLALPQVLDRLAASSGVIGIDTGLSHLAVALGLPHVQLFSQPRMARAGPLPCAHQLAVGGDAPPAVEVVWQAWQQVVLAAPQRTPPA